MCLIQFETGPEPACFHGGWFYDCAFMGGGSIDVSSYTSVAQEIRRNQLS